MKTNEGIMEILAAYDLTGSYREAAALVGCSHHTVASYVRARDAGGLKTAPVPRSQLIDPFRDKIEEWVEASHGRIRADVALRKLEPMGFTGSDRTLRRAIAEAVVGSQEYLDEVIAWTRQAHVAWLRNLAELPDDSALDELRSPHWGQRVPLFDIVARIARHHVYHAGEINQLLSIARGEAWEEFEEVEENHISTIGHRVRPPWLSVPDPD